MLHQIGNVHKFRHKILTWDALKPWALKFLQWIFLRDWQSFFKILRISVKITSSSGIFPQGFFLKIIFWFNKIIDFNNLNILNTVFCLNNKINLFAYRNQNAESELEKFRYFLLFYSRVKFWANLRKQNVQELFNVVEFAGGLSCWSNWRSEC